LKFIEVSGGFLQPISNEENIVLERVRGHDGPLPKAVLDERERELATNLVRRGFLTRIMHENKLCFTLNLLEDLWES
jgi:hypothetical protein